MKKSKAPFVSIVVSTYNGEKILAGCLESLVAQDYPKDRYEVIAVNDGSTDGTAGILKNYPVRVIHHEKNMGLAAGRNTGLKNSKGEVVAFTDDDCIASADWISKLVEKYADKSVDGVGGAIKPYSVSSVLERYVLYSRKPIYSHARVKNAVERIGEYIKSLVRGPKEFSDGELLSGLMGCNSSYRKKILEDAGLFNPLFKRGGDDWEMCIKLNRKGCKLKYAKNAVILHRHREDFASFLTHIFRYGEDSVLASKVAGIRLMFHPIPVIFLVFALSSTLHRNFLLYALLLLGLGLAKELPWSIAHRNVKLLIALPIIENIREFVYDFGILSGLVKYRRRT